MPVLYDLITGEPKPDYLERCSRAREMLKKVDVL